MYAMYNTSFQPNKILNHMEATVKPRVTCKGREYSTTQITTRYTVKMLIQPPLSHMHLQCINSRLAATHLLRHKYLYSTTSTRRDVAARSYSGSGVSGTSGFDRNDLFHKMKELWDSSVANVASEVGEKAKKALDDQVTPHIQQLLNTYYSSLLDASPFVGGTIIGTIVAMAILPWILKRFHKYSTEGQINSFLTVVPYEESMWGALENPVRYLIIVMALSQMTMKVAPTTTASLASLSKNVLILSFVLFLQQWGGRVGVRALEKATYHEVGVVLALYRILIGGTIVIYCILAANVFGVSLIPIWTAGGIGGVVTGLAAKDTIADILSGLKIQLTRPFVPGDTIKAGSLEGKVMDIRLTTTIMLGEKNIPMLVPNSLFSNQVIVNESRVPFRSMVSKILVQIDDFEKIPQISKEITNMMKSNSNVFLGSEQPYCYMSRVENSFAELTLGCNLKRERKDYGHYILYLKGQDELTQIKDDMLYLEEQDVLLQSIQIIKKHGATFHPT